MLTSIQKSFYVSYKRLFFALFLLFVFRPEVNHLLYLGVWKLFLTIVLISTIVLGHEKKNVKTAVIFLAVPALFFCWTDLLFERESLFIINVLLTLVFLAICLSSIISNIIRSARVGSQTISGVICAYFLVAFFFAYIFYLIDFLHPGAIPASELDPSFSLPHSLSDMLYFSFTTLLMWGATNAGSSIAQTVIAIEGMAGQLYIAILVSKIVSVYSLSPQRLAELIKKGLHELK